MLHLLAAAVLGLSIHLATIALAARAMGLAVREVSWGYGPTLFHIRGLRIGLIPLGGYVKLLRSDEEPVPASALHTAIDSRPVSEQLFVMLSGCCVLLLLALALGGATALDAFVALPGQLFRGAVSPLDDAQLLIRNAAAAAQSEAFLPFFARVAAKLAALNFLPLPGYNGGAAVAILAKHTRLTHLWPARATELLLFLTLGIYFCWWCAIAFYAKTA